MAKKIHKDFLLQLLLDTLALFISTILLCQGKKGGSVKTLLHVNVASSDNFSTLGMSHIDANGLANQPVAMFLLTDPGTLMVLGTYKGAYSQCSLTFLTKIPHLSRSVMSKRQVCSSSSNGRIWHTESVNGSMALSSAKIGNPWKFSGFLSTADKSCLTREFVSTLTSPNEQLISDTS